MRIYIINILLLTINSSIFGQSGIIQGKITSEKGVGIPFAAIGIIERNMGTVAFEDGTFSLKSDESYLKDSLVVSALGFERRKVAYADLFRGKQREILLKEKVSVLEEVVIVPSKIKYKWKGGAGFKFLYSDPFYLAPRNGSTLAVMFDKFKDPVWIKEISVRAGGRNLDSFLLRCRIFSVDENLFPDEEILNTDLIHTMKENGEAKFVLEEELYMDRPFFVGFEWVMSKDHYKEVEKVYEAFPLKFLEEMTKDYPGLETIISNNRTLLLRDSLGRLKKALKIPQEHRVELEEKGKVMPVVYYLCSPSGPRTVYGSYITGKWNKYFLHADVSLLVGVR